MLCGQASWFGQGCHARPTPEELAQIGTAGPPSGQPVLHAEEVAFVTVDSKLWSEACHSHTSGHRLQSPQNLLPASSCP